MRVSSSIRGSFNSYRCRGKLIAFALISIMTRHSLSAAVGARQQYYPVTRLSVVPEMRQQTLRPLPARSEP